MAAASLAHRAEVRAEELECEVCALRAEGREFAAAIDTEGRRAYREIALGHLAHARACVRSMVSLASRRLRQTREQAA